MENTLNYLESGSQGSWFRSFVVLLGAVQVLFAVTFVTGADSQFLLAVLFVFCGIWLARQASEFHWKQIVQSMKSVGCGQFLQSCSLQGRPGTMWFRKRLSAMLSDYCLRIFLAADLSGPTCSHMY